MSKSDPIPGQLGLYCVTIDLGRSLRTSTMVTAISRAAAIAATKGGIDAEVLRWASEAEKAEGRAAYEHRQATWAAITDAARTHGIEAVRAGYAHDPALLAQAERVMRYECTLFDGCPAVIHRPGCNQAYQDDRAQEAARA